MVHWDFVARVFDIKGPTFERLCKGFLEVISDDIYHRCVIERVSAWTMGKLAKEEKQFKNYPFARYAVDVTFQNSNRPTGNLQEARKDYSGKHKLYGYKVEVSLLPNGLAALCSEHYPGSVSDIDIFANMVDAHKVALQKGEEEKMLEDDGPLQEEHPDQWAALADNGYQGATELLVWCILSRSLVRAS